MRFQHILVMLLAFCLSLPSFATGAEAPQPRTLRVVMDNNYPPFVFLDAEGRVQGILPDQWHLWEKKTGVRVEIHAMDWDEALRRMRAGEYDVIDTIFHTQARARLYDYLPPYQKIEVPIYFDREIAGITGADSLKGFAVGAKAGDAAIDVLRRHGVESLVLYTSYEAIALAARDRKITVFVVDAPPARYFLHKFGIHDRFRQTEPLYVGEFHRAVRKGDAATLGLVRSGFEAITRQEHQAIERKWYGSAAFEAFPVRQMLTVAAGFTVLAAALFLWNRSLRRAVAQRTLELKKSEERSRAMVEALPDMVFRISRDGTFLDYHSVSTGETLFRPPQEFLGRNVRDVMPPEIPALTEDRLALAIAGSGTQRFEYSLEMKGILRHFEARMVTCGESEVMAIVRDVTDQKRVENEILKSEDRLRSIYNSVHDSIFIHDAESGKILDVNAQACSMYGYSHAEMLARSVGDISSGFSPYSQKDAITWLQKVAAEGPQGFQWNARHKDGHLFWVDVAMSKTVIGQEERVIAAVRDVSERKRLEEQLLQSQKMEAVGILAGGVAHDFNNILQAIVTSAYLMKMRHNDIVDIQQIAGDILLLSDRAADLTRGLLAFSRKHILMPQVVDMNEIVRSTLRMFQRLMGEDITVAADFCAERLMVSADSAHMQQVLVNLMNNARDAMPTGGTLTIRSYRDVCSLPDDADNLTQCPCAVLEVRDSGDGIDEKDIGHIFEPFYTTKEVGKGTGLGLSVVYGIVRQHKGIVEALPAPGRGTVFRVALPLEPSAGRDAPENSQTPGRGLGKTILLVEDEESVRLATEQLLEAYGYTVLAAASGAEAIAHVRRHDQGVHLALIDIIMPGMNGADVCTALRAINPKLKVIFLSGYPQQVLEDRKLGDMHYLAKPILPKDLLAVIEQTLSSDVS